MPRKPTKHPRLVDRDYDILEHLMRYRLTTREILHPLYFSDSDINAVTKVTSRLVRHGFLNKHDLYTGRSYYVVGPKAARIIGINPKRCKALGPQALPCEYGILKYCCNGPVPRQRLMVSEVQDRQPDLLAKGIDSSHYYLDHDGASVRLAYIRVDQGGPPDHIARKCHEDIEKRIVLKSFREYIENDRFMIAIVTAREQKAADIRNVIARRRWPVSFRVEVVDELAQLITRSDSV